MKKYIIVADWWGRTESAYSNYEIPIELHVKPFIGLTLVTEEIELLITGIKYNIDSGIMYLNCTNINIQKEITNL